MRSAQSSIYVDQTLATSTPRMGRSVPYSAKSARARGARFRYLIPLVSTWDVQPELAYAVQAVPSEAACGLAREDSAASQGWSVERYLEGGIGIFVMRHCGMRCRASREGREQFAHASACRYGQIAL